MKNIFLLIALLVSFSPQKANSQTVNFSELRERLFAELTGIPYNQNNSIIKNRLQSIASSANTYWESLIKSNGRTTLWSDLSFSTPADITEAHSRLQSMAIALKSPGCSLYENASLKTDIISALDWMYVNKYNERTATTGNWWDYMIGAPLRLNNSVVLLYDDLTPTQRNNYMNAVDHHCNKVDGYTAANLAWIVNIIGTRAILVSDMDKLVYARNSLLPSIQNVTVGDGFYDDGSFIQHDKQPYNGAYGLSYLSTVVQVMQLFSDTEIDIPQSYKNQMLEWIYTGFEPLIYRGALFCFVRGREISRIASTDNKKGKEVCQVLMKLCKMVGTEDRERLQGIIKHYLTTDATFTSPYDGLNSVGSLVEAEKILTNTQIVARKSYNLYHQYVHMDRAVVHRPNFAFGIAMHSSRIYNFEMTNNENLKGWFTSAGATYLYNTEAGQYSSHYWPTVDAYKMAGTTVPVGKTYPRNKSTLSDWVGGVELLKYYGVTGMDFNTTGVLGVKAKKSWFMFDNEIVALGSDISNNINTDVNTYIEQRKLSTDNRNTFIVNGISQNPLLGDDNSPVSLNQVSWAHLSGKYTNAEHAIGYYFPEKTDLKAVRKQRTGKYSEINQYGSTDIYSNYFLTFWKEQKNQSSNTESDYNKYAYVLLPGFTSANVEKYSQDPDIEILENTARIHAVKEKKMNIVGVNFWENDSQQKIQINDNEFLHCDKQASVMAYFNNDSIVVSISDPTQKNTGKIKLVLENISADKYLKLPDNVEIVSLSPSIELNIDMKDSRGKTSEIVLSKNYTSIISPSLTDDFTLSRIGKDELLCNVYSSKSHNSLFKFYNLQGMPCLEKVMNIESGENAFTFDISTLSDGFYIVNANIDNKNRSAKFMK